MKMAYEIFLVFGFASSLLLDWAEHILPSAELKRRAKLDSSAKKINNLQSYNFWSHVIIWLIGTASAAIIIIWSSKIDYTNTAVLVVVISLLTTVHRGMGKPNGIFWSMSGFLAGGLVSLLRLLRVPPKKISAKTNYKFYEVTDLYEFFKTLSNQKDSRISERDLTAAEAALGFSAKDVKSVMKPMKEVRIVLPDEYIGPHLMSELYASGYAAFPVGKKPDRKSAPVFEGTVYIKDLTTNPNSKSVAQLMSDKVAYIKESQSLSEALETFLNSRQFLLIVQNIKNESVGVIWIEDVLAQLMGRSFAAEREIPADADNREKMLK